MTQNELKRLSRSDLLQMLLKQSKELKELKQTLAATEEALQDKRIMINKAGSIAEASLKLNGVFEATQTACQQYIENIAHLSHRQKVICAQMELESKKRAERIIAEAQVKSDEMIQNAKVESQQYWDTVSEKMQTFVKEHAEFNSILSTERRQE